MAGTNSERTLIAEGPAIILVHPQLGENIGMVARAMANFGLAELRLVNPRDGWPSEKAISAASKADHVIEAAKVYPSLEEAVADLEFVYATTARDRYGYKEVRSPVVAADDLRTRFRAGQKTGILFGRERTGLTNEEIALADELVTFPVNPAFASLNLAQAVLLMSYEWMKSGLASVEDTPFDALPQRPAKSVATTVDAVAIDQFLAQSAGEIGLTLDRNEARGQGQATIAIATARAPVLTDWLASLEAQGFIIDQLTITPAADGTVGLTAELRKGGQ